eukprot:951208-Amphidinium_carterae.1
MAHGGPTGDPRVSADLSTVRVWQRQLAAGMVTWPLFQTIWEGALRKGRGRGPICNLRMMADRFGSRPCDARFATAQVGWAESETNVKTALNAALGGVWHEARVHA